MFLKFIIINLAGGVFCNNYKDVQVKIHKTVCSEKSEYATDIVCEIGENGKGVFGITLVKPADHIRIILTTHTKDQDNYGPLRVTDSLCFYSSGNQEGMMFLLLPFLPQMIGELIQKCPYNAGRYELFDIEIPTNYTLQHVFSSFESSGDYRANLRFMDPDDITIFEIDTYFYLKKKHEGYY